MAELFKTDNGEAEGESDSSQPRRKIRERDARGRDKAPQVSKAIGKAGEESHTRFTNELVEQWLYYRDQCRPTWDTANRMLKLHLAKIEEKPKKREEKWMRKVFVPLPTSISEAKVATLIVGIMTAADPLVTAEGVGPEDFEKGHVYEQYLDYVYRKNRWRGKTLPSWVRMNGIQGTEFFKVTYAHEATVAHFPRDPKRMLEWQKRFAEFLMVMQGGARAGGPQGFLPPGMLQDPMGTMFKDPKLVSLWIQEMKKRGLNPPEPPAFGDKEVIRYRGPKFSRIPLSRVVLNPSVDEIEGQPMIVHQMAKSKAWLERQVEQGKLDGKAVEFAAKKSKGNAPNTQQDDEEHEQRIRELFGIGKEDADDRFMRINGDLQEVLEVYRPDADDERRYAVILNRTAIVNRGFELPYKHGRSSVGAIRNFWIRGNFFGLPDHQVTESVIRENNQLRSLRLWRTTLETLPVFKRRKELGMAGVNRGLVPGGSIPVMDMEGLQTLIKYEPTNAFADLALVQANIEEGTGVDSSVRGREASLNRVPATESSARMNQAKMRLLLQAYLLEEELQTLNEQSLWITMQRMPLDVRFKVGGKELMLSPEDLLEALSIDLRFRGATTAMKTDQDIAKVMEVIGSTANVMQPFELRESARFVLQLLRISQVDRLLQPEVTSALKEDYETQRAAAQQQAQVAQQQQEQAAIQPPTKMGAKEAARMMNGGSGPQPAAGGQGQGAGAGQGTPGQQA